VTERFLVVDSSALILLSKIESLVLLDQLAAEVIVPAAVQKEVLMGGRFKPVRLESLERLRLVPDLPLPPEIAGWDLGVGESQVLAYAAAVAGSEAVLDDLQAHQCAKALGYLFTGTAGVILRSKTNGSILAARPLLEELLRVGLYLPRELADAMLAEVGE
jgi:predicted nucleic acid-binding protein